MILIINIFEFNFLLHLILKTNVFWSKRLRILTCWAQQWLSITNILMTKNEACHLRDLISTIKSRKYCVTEFITKGRTISNFHVWADGKKYEGAYLVKNRYEISLWLIFIEWKPGRFYLIIFPENRNGPLLEIHRLEKSESGDTYLGWTYKPTKRDVKNLKRVEYFSKYYFSPEVTISFPVDLNEIDDFLDEVFTLTDVRIKADLLDDAEPEFRDAFPEGKKIERYHKTRERNPTVIRLAKKEFKRKNGKLFCQVCNFDFEKRYGKVGEDFIEAHHTMPLSQVMDDKVETKLSDIALLCSNCHRMVHRKRPWLSIREISKLIKKV